MQNTKKLINSLLIGLAVLVVVTIWDGLYVLPEGEQAVVTQFGRPVGDPVNQAGLKFKMPFIQEVQFFDKRILIWDGEPNQIPTNDKTFVYVDNTARWRITDPLRFLQAVGTEQRANTLLNDIIAGTVRDMVNRNDLIEVIRSSDWSDEYMTSTVQSRDLILTPPSVGRDRIAQEVLEAAARVTPQYGIELTDVMFRRVNYIESVRLRVYDRMISERNRIAAERRSTGEGQKAEILGRVERDRLEIISAAEREAFEIRGQADAEATRIYAEAYSLDPEFFAFLKSMESYQDIISGNSSLVLSTDSDLFRYLERHRLN
ncbi:protease modulator HflC [Desulfobulbus alkaliphilus]|uniref:protease modulator HflC n=1 Tax=Desulfobulbus alkaliphilus TaxID=869814 RepID=UPI00196699B3|nr:protease modulator HflC [Desulfobulbus alkaliphilus]MBM9535961.1 protease modulator HflC [Desulfobulbus alkaliphilus]